MALSRHIQSVRRSLLRWYCRHARDLPWRRTSDPYAIWLSEIMLQQTRVETVARYFEQFLDRFPCVGDLAAAALDEVLKLWEGMGYYGRARNLHKAARMVVGELDGKFPQNAEGWRKLPGIGRYTAGAIVSIAFGGDEPVLDGNVVRVLCRVFRVESDPKSAAAQKRLWALAADLLPPGKAGAFNQAMMDLGATLCVPRHPRCGACPLEGLCEARAHGDQEGLPLRSKRRCVPHEDVVVGIVRKGDRILIDRRKPEGLLGGLWELPGGKIEKGESMGEALVREIREEIGIEVEIGRHLLNVHHAYTHLRVTLHIFDARWKKGRERAVGCSAVEWVRPEDLGKYAFPAATLRIIDRLR